MAWSLFPVFNNICYVFLCTVVNVPFSTHSQIHIHLTNIYLQKKLPSCNDLVLLWELFSQHLVKLTFFINFVCYTELSHTDKP